MNTFEELNSINVNEKTEKKKSGNTELTYLSWPWAWAEVKRRFEDASYTIWKDEQNRPYILDPATGYMVYTSVTIGGITHEMWLPVMDGANKAMKDVPYKYTTKFSGEKTCEAATMMDINKTIMRCLVKNLAMFGLGLYIYAGEDLPESDKEESKPTEVTNVTPIPKKVAEATVIETNKVPPIKVVTVPATEIKPVAQYLTTAMAGLREMRGITPSQNNKLFRAQLEALIAAKLAPNKKLEEYTMEEAASLIDAMEKCFDPTGTELRKK